MQTMLLEKLIELLQTDTFYYSALLMSVSVLSFGLGRLADNPPAVLSPTTQPAAVTLTQTPVSTNDTATLTGASTGQLVGSKNGTKYHALWCPGANQIKEENKRFFTDEKEAQSYGYTPAANCEF